MTTWAYQKAWRGRNPVDRRKQVLLALARERAIKHGLEFAIKKGDLHWPPRCPVLGIELNYLGGTNGPADNSPSIDRCDPDQGYVPGNVMVISVRANRMKSNCRNGDELRAVAKYVDLYC